MGRILEPGTPILRTEITLLAQICKQDNEMSKAAGELIILNVTKIMVVLVSAHRLKGITKVTFQ